MDELQFRREFLRQFSKNGKLNNNTSPYMIIKFIVDWVSKCDTNQEILDYIKEEKSALNNLMNYIADNTSPYEGIKPCSDELIKSRNLNRDTIVPYIFKPLEDYYRANNA